MKGGGMAAMLGLGRCRSSGMLRAHGTWRRCFNGKPCLPSSVESPVAPRRVAEAAAAAAVPPLLPLPMPNEEVAILQERLKYNFRDPRLLEDALIDASYPNRSLSSLTVPPTPRSYKPLKIIGERALLHYMRAYASKELVHLNLSPYTLARTALHLGLYQFLRRDSSKLDHAVDEFFKLQQGKLPYPGVPLKVPIVLTDLVYSFMGAIVADNDYQDKMAWQIMEQHLPIFSVDDLDLWRSVATLFYISEDFNLGLRFTYKRMTNIHSCKTFLSKVTHGHGSSCDWNHAKGLSALEALNKLPAFMFTDSKCGSPIPMLDKLSPLL